MNASETRLFALPILLESRLADARFQDCCRPGRVPRVADAGHESRDPCRRVPWARWVPALRGRSLLAQAPDAWPGRHCGGRVTLPSRLVTTQAPATQRYFLASS